MTICSSSDGSLNLFSKIASLDGALKLFAGGRQIKSLVPVIDVARCFKFMEERKDIWVIGLNNSEVLDRISENTDITELAEDVGRHNAMDKIVGRSLKHLPLSNHGFLLSGRVSFEMVQKAVVSGSPCIVAIGAPTTLAIQLARQHGITPVSYTHLRAHETREDSLSRNVG